MKEPKSITDLLISFLHDVFAVEATAGNELGLKEENYRSLAEEYAEEILNSLFKGLN